MNILNSLFVSLKKTSEFLLNRMSSIRPQKFFLITALTFGFCYVIINPIFQAPDEHSHFYRAAGIANGHLLPNIENGYDKSIIQSGTAELYKFYALSNEIVDSKYNYEIKKLLALPMGNTREKFFGVSTTLYTPISYLPQIATYFVGAILKINPFILFLLVRLAGLLAWITLIYFAIKIIPRGKWLLTAMALMPISLFISSAVSADTITNGLVFLVVSIVFTVLANPKLLSKKLLLAIIVVFILLALAKQGMALISLLILILPTPAYFTKNKFRIIKVLVVILAILASGLWQLYVSPVAALITLEGVNSAEQISFLAEKPVRLLRIFWNTYLNFGSDGIYYSSLVALGMLNVVLPIWVGLAWVVALVKSIGPTKVGKNDLLKNWQKIYFIAVSTILFGAITMALYLTWTRPGLYRVDGLQGRYFIPVLAILIPALVSKRAEPTKSSLRYLIVFIITLQIITLWLFFTFYSDHQVY